MRLLKVAAAVLNQTPLDWLQNRRNIQRAIDDSRAQGAALLCLPELCISGYGCEDAFHASSTASTAWSILQELLPSTSGMVVSFGLPILYQHSVFNCACLAVDGRIAGFAAKRFLAGDGIHYEPRWFKPWPAGVVRMLKAAGNEYPIGDLLFDIGGIRIGFEICEDAWVAQRPGTAMARRGVDLILNPSASHFAFGKTDIRKRFVLEGSRAFGVGYVYSNLLGNEAGRAIYDGDAMIASHGRMIAEGPRFSYDDVYVTSGQIDLEVTQLSRARLASFQPDMAEATDNVVSRSFAWPVLSPEEKAAPFAPWEGTDHQKEEEFTRAVTLALFDYLRKTRSQGFVVSLSGGADSTAVAVLCALMVHFGIDSLGLQRFREKLSHIASIQKLQEREEIIRALLLCVYQSTANSSDTTLNAARTVAEHIGAEFIHVDVEDLRARYVAMASQAMGRELTWERDDISLQNIQARVRSPGVWMLANLRGALLLATSNRSEAAVGYATMDGDTSGGLSPIAGIDKAYLRRWLQWMEQHGPQAMEPMPFLEAVTKQKPTAELRPPSHEQTDEADLMPYELLDAVERATIRDKKAPVEVFELMRVRFPHYDLLDLLRWLERFYRLWCRNQWKRERYAPSFHLDDENLDPKTWCRFPILSGGYELELQELRAHVERVRAKEQR